MVEPAIEVAGSLWSVPRAEQSATLLELRAAGLTHLHWDTSDGEFAAAGGFAADRARELVQELTDAAPSGSRRTGSLDSCDPGVASPAVSLPPISEAHVMAEDPLLEIDAWTGFCEIVYVHLESDRWRDAVARIERRGSTPGLAISPGTRIAEVPAELPALVMSIAPGAAGASFSTVALDRIAALRAAGSSRRIGVDGGVTRAHVERARAAGADALVVGTDLISPGGAARWVDVLRGRTGTAKPGSGG